MNAEIMFSLTDDERREAHFAVDGLTRLVGPAARERLRWLLRPSGQRATVDEMRLTIAALVHLEEALTAQSDPSFWSEPWRKALHPVPVETRIGDLSTEKAKLRFSQAHRVRTFSIRLEESLRETLDKNVKSLRHSSAKGRDI